MDCNCIGAFWSTAQPVLLGILGIGILAFLAYMLVRYRVTLGLTKRTRQPKNTEVEVSADKGQCRAAMMLMVGLAVVAFIVVMGLIGYSVMTG